MFILAGKTGPALDAALSSIFVVAGIASFALAAFSLTLPPHRRRVTRERGAIAPLEAIRLLKVPAFLVLFVVTFMDALVHQCYFQWTSPFLEAGGAAGQLDHAGDEHRPGRRDRDHGGARLRAEPPGLARDDGHRHRWRMPRASSCSRSAIRSG